MKKLLLAIIFSSLTISPCFADEILDLEINENGLYLVPVHEPINYLDYEVLSTNEKEAKKMM